MSAKRHCNFLVVGQGLAGSLLAWCLEQRGKQVLLLDEGHRHAASLAAGGLINPLAGMRFSRPARIDDWLASAIELYEVLRRALGRRYFHPMPMVRLFRSTDQLRFWRRRADDPQSAHLLGERFAAQSSGQPVTAPLGGFHQKQTGYVDVATLITDLKEHFLRQGAYREAHIDCTQIEPRGTCVVWRDLQAERLIFCEGYRGMYNPWFDWLPFQTDRGEILTFASEDSLPDRIANGAHWLVPLSDGQYRFGATHDRSGIGLHTTPKGRRELLDGLSGLLTRSPTIEITQQRAGVRPGSRDRQPFLGRHPNQPRLAIFNGFGARGCLTVPWYAQQLVANLERDQPLPPESDIRRHT
jgi:glycine/D-amino acid oxidase-like deaminating enzyme